MIYVSLFVIGTAVGSFLNVMSLRFNPKEDRLWKNVYGRSHCPHCGKTLSWYELVPFFSFLAQLGKCRSCGVRLTLQYPIVEFLGGLIFFTVPYALLPYNIVILGIPYVLIILWILVLLSLLLMSVIDFHHHIIPDSINLFILALGVILIAYRYFGFEHNSLGGYSYLKSYAMLFPLSDSFPWAYLLGFGFGGLLLGALYYFSGGRGMGFGDVKLAAVLGLFIGWPDIMLALGLAFVLGGFLSVGLLALHSRTMKDHLPFGPFIALGFTIIFFFGEKLMGLYFNFFNLLLPF